MKIIAGTRGSRLALVQTENIIEKIKKIEKNIETSIRIIKTKGDIITDQHILSISGDGAFEKEVNSAVTNSEVDFAVHSMKDIPIEIDENLMLVAVPKREAPYDMLVSKNGYNFNDIPKGAIVGTGSPRREAQLRYLRSDLKIKSIRGNIDTRIRKLEEGLYDAIILAKAGLNRLHISKAAKKLSENDFPTAPGQGALAITIRKDRKDLKEIFSKLNHLQSNLEITAERAFLSEIGGGCKLPIAALAKARDNKLSINAMILSFDGKQRYQSIIEGELKAAEEIGRKAAKQLIKKSEGKIKLVKQN